MAQDIPPAMQQIGAEMEAVQDMVEKKLRPMLATQFRCMGDVMGDQYADSKQIQESLGGCQKEAAQVQAELDRAVQNFGQGMQRGMETCQRQVQQAMQAGSITEQVAQSQFMACAGNVAEGQLKNIPVLKMEVERILRNL